MTRTSPLSTNRADQGRVKHSSLSIVCTLSYSGIHRHVRSWGGVRHPCTPWAIARSGQMRLSSIVNLLQFAATICGQFEVASLWTPSRGAAFGAPVPGEMVSCRPATPDVFAPSRASTSRRGGHALGPSLLPTTVIDHED